METNEKTVAFKLSSVLVVGMLVFATFGIASAQTVSRQLEPGDSGSDVSALQTFLAADSTVYPEGLVTGFYGSLTTTAVQRYQCKNGIVCQGDVASTGYGRVGPATLAKIQLQGGLAPGGGVTLPPVGYPSFGADINAPALSRPSVSMTSTAAIIHWTTNEPAQSSVLYATVPPALNAESFAAMAVGFDTTLNLSSDVTLTGLAPNTVYFYVLKSVDASGNMQYGIEYSFRTNP